mgnify:CR=1 FL=1
MRRRENICLTLQWKIFYVLETELFEFIQTKYPEISESIKTEKVITEENEATLVKAIEEFKLQFTHQ